MTDSTAPLDGGVAPGSWGPVAAAGGVLVAANIVNNRVLPDGDGPYVAACMTTAGLLVALARADGQSWRQLGLSTRDVRSGLVWGLAAGSVAKVATLAGGAASGALHDDRGARRGIGGAVRAALVRVPFGTVLLEEVAFRSVLPAMLGRRVGEPAGTAATAAAFGAWHILPSATLHDDNAALGRTLRTRPAATAAAVVSTAAAHLALADLRRRSRSVVAPALVHWAVNGAGYVAAAIVGARTAPSGRATRARRGAGAGEWVGCIDPGTDETVRWCQTPPDAANRLRGL